MLSEGHDDSAADRAADRAAMGAYGSGPWEEPRVRPLFREEYERLIELGAFENERIELLEGKLLRMPPQGEPHASVTTLLNELLVTALRGRARVRPQMPIAASDVSEPEPDLAVVPITPGVTRPSSAFLIIEVANTSLRDDLEQKVPIYARARFPEVWVVDVRGRCVYQLRKPDLGRYTERRILQIDGTLALEAFPDVTFPVAAIFLTP